MTQEEVMAEVLRLQNIIDVDLFYRLVALLEIDVATLPQHPAIEQLEELDDDIVHVQNKIGVHIPNVVPAVPADSVPGTPVQEVPAKPKPAAKKAPPQLPKSTVTVPVPAAGSTVPEQEVPEQQMQHVPATPQAALKEEAPETAAEPKLKASMLNAHTVCVESNQVVIDDGADNRPAVPASFGPCADQMVADYVKQPREWGHVPVQGPSVPGCSTKGGKGTTTPIIQAEWNMYQWPDLPQQASLVTCQILQQLMNMAKNAESRISATEQLVRNQFDILSSSPGGQLQPGTVPALLQHAVQHRDMLKRIAEERAVQASQEQSTSITAVEAYHQLSECHDQIIDEHEKLEAKIADMEAKFNKLLEAQIKLSKKMEEFQTDRSRLIETNKRL
eukprot:6457191-Amphidinium_carterae.1